jgi:phosphopantetheinyl transferase
MDTKRDAWIRNDILIFLVDIDRYPAYTSILTDEETRFAEAYKSAYFKKRYTLSHTLIKTFLREILGKDTAFNILPTKNDQSRRPVHNSENPWISLSYSGNFLCITLAKQKAACDMEKIRCLDIKNIDKYPVFQGMERDEVSDNRVRLWKRWTEIEAYAKFSGVPLFLCLQGFSQGGNGYFSRSYLINNELIVTVMSERHNPLIAFISGNDNANSMKYAIV